MKLTACDFLAFGKVMTDMGKPSLTELRQCFSNLSNEAESCL
jgi:hypothetical protein